MENQKFTEDSIIFWNLPVRYFLYGNDCANFVPSSYTTDEICPIFSNHFVIQLNTPLHPLAFITFSEGLENAVKELKTLYSL